MCMQVREALPWLAPAVPPPQQQQQQQYMPPSEHRRYAAVLICRCVCCSSRRLATHLVLELLHSLFCHCCTCPLGPVLLQLPPRCSISLKCLLEVLSHAAFRVNHAAYCFLCQKDLDVLCAVSPLHKQPHPTPPHQLTLPNSSCASAPSPSRIYPPASCVSAPPLSHKPGRWRVRRLLCSTCTSSPSLTAYGGDCGTPSCTYVRPACRHWR